jgi:hypothetical protein
VPWSLVQPTPPLPAQEGWIYTVIRYCVEWSLFYILMLCASDHRVKRNIFWAALGVISCVVSAIDVTISEPAVASDSYQGYDIIVR